MSSYRSIISKIFENRTENEVVLGNLVEPVSLLSWLVYAPSYIYNTSLKKKTAL